MITVLTLTLTPTTSAISASVAKIQIQAITDSKPGEVEITFLSQGSKSPKSLITSYQIIAKPVGASGLEFSKNYSKRVSGYMKQKVSPLSPGVDYIFTLTQRSVDKKVTRATPHSFTTEPTSPSAPRITSASATDSDEAVIFFDAPKDDGGTPILSYTVTANPGQIITTSNQQVAGSITALGLTKATNYTFTITAQNLYGRSEPSLISPSVTTLAQKIVRITPTAAAALAVPAFSLSSASETRTVNTAATGFTSTSTGGAIANFAINTTPPGMSFNTTTGALTGTPNTVAAATNYTITASNATGSATQTFRLTVSAVVYTVGQAGPGGGIIFYVASTPFACGPTRAATCSYLEVAPNTWDGGTEDPIKPWSVDANKHIDVTAIPNEPAANNDISGLGVGLQNSIAIVNQGNDTTTAAGAVRAYRGGTQSDWFLPATVELNLLCQWARNVTQSISTPCLGGALNTGTGATGGFANTIYWSSVEHNGSDVRFQNFSNGEQSNQLGKNTSIRVRPIRAF